MTEIHTRETRDHPGWIALATALAQLGGLAVVGLVTLVFWWVSPGPPDDGLIMSPLMWGMGPASRLYLAEPPRRRSAVVVGLLTWAVAAALVVAVVASLAPAFLGFHGVVIVGSLVGMAAAAAFAAVLRRG